MKDKYFIAALLAGPAFAFGSISFVLWDVQVHEWHEASRFLLVVLTLGWWVLAGVFNAELIRLQESENE